MSDKLADLSAEAETFTENVRTSFGDLTGEQLNWKMSAAVWSVGQCFDHLIVTNNLYFPAIQKVVDGAHRNNFFSKIPFAPDVISALMKNSLKPEQARKMKTFKIFEPSASDVSAQILDDFAANQRKLIEMIEAVKNLDLRGIKIPEPLSVALNLRLDDAFEILLLHEKRHFLQAERVMQSHGFPR